MSRQGYDERHGHRTLREPLENTGRNKAKSQKKLVEASRVVDGFRCYDGELVNDTLGQFSASSFTCVLTGFGIVRYHRNTSKYHKRCL